jgi:tRNA pseudouridine13 synthase
MYKIKEQPEDFVVIEELSLPRGEGKYSYYLLKKYNITTLEAVERIASSFRIQNKYLNFSGTKDKRAITEQYISISMGPERDLELPSIKLKYLGKGKERINLGTHTGNKFMITVRNIKEKPQPIQKILNLFDDQRFGKQNNNHIIGKLLVQKKFKEAIPLIDDEHAKNHLEASPNDFVGAIKCTPKKLLLLFIHAYQSHLWNEMAMNSEQETLPLIGYDTKATPQITALLKREGITARDFVCRQIPVLSSEGSVRSTKVKVDDLIINDPEPDELNPGMNKVKLEFSLPKGSYATMVVKQLFGEKCTISIP